MGGVVLERGFTVDLLINALALSVLAGLLVGSVIGSTFPPKRTISSPLATSIDIPIA
jgi:hypothetical protein